jgi:thiamine-phosphate pyrophosphorylase
MLNEYRQPEIKDFLKCYLVFEEDMLKVPLDEFVPAVIEGGVTAFQLRNKQASVKENYALGLKLQKMLAGTNVLFVINDRIDLACAIKAPCVHLGIKDLPVDIARQVYADTLYGYSCNDIADLRKAETTGADYIGVGPAFFTGTKKDLREVRGIDGIKELATGTKLPAVAIGGINANNIHELKGTGIAGVAVSSAICASDDPYNATKLIRELSESL